MRLSRLMNDDRIKDLLSKSFSGELSAEEYEETVKSGLGPRHAILSENGDVLECDLMTWARSMEEGYRRIRQEYLAGGYWLSTVFLGLDHNYSMQGPPWWFETMIFRPPTGDVSPITGRVSEHGGEIYCERYPTFAEALEGHARAKEWFNERDYDEGNLRRYD